MSFVSSYRYLALELDRHLKMDLHLKNVIHKVRPIAYKLSKIRYLLDQKTALIICKTHILPVLEFDLFMLDNYYKGQVETLQQVQNKRLRLCFQRDSRFPARQLHLKANLLPLRYWREVCLLNLLNKKLIKGDSNFQIDLGKSI